MRFSKRECVLLTVLAVLLIWSVGRSRILEPAMERRMSAREECSRLERERIEAEQFIDVVIVSEPTLEESGDRFFYETMEDVAFDRLFQRMARESGLTVRRLEIIRSESGKGDFQPERAVPRAESTDSAGNSGGAGSSGGAGEFRQCGEFRRCMEFRQSGKCLRPGVPVRADSFGAGRRQCSGCNEDGGPD